MDARKRRAALEEKKKRIEEMRRRREQRQEAQSTEQMESVPAAPDAAAAAPRQGEDLDEYITSLLSQPPAAQAEVSAPERESSGPAEVVTQAPRTVGVVKATLSVQSSIAELMIPPLREQLITYSKEVQTDEAVQEFKDTQTDPSDFPSTDAVNDSEEGLAEESRAELAGEAETKLTEEGLEEIAASAAFGEFMRKVGPVLERELDKGEAFDIIVKLDDATIGHASSDAKATLSEVLVPEGQARGRPIMDLQYHPVEGDRLLIVAYGARGGMGSATEKMETAGKEWSSPGLVILWTLTHATRQALVFPCSSPVLSVQWLPGNTHLFAAATYAGLVYVFDTRRRGRHVACSSIITEADEGGHAHPVYCLAAFPGSKSNSATALESDVVLLSCDTSGKLCFWQCNSLSKGPRTWVSLQRGVGMSTGRVDDASGLANSINTTSMDCTLTNSRDQSGRGLQSPAEAILQGETDIDVYLGTESGDFYRARVAVGSATRSGLEDVIGVSDGRDTEQAHQSLVTAIHLHPSQHATAGSGGSRPRLQSVDSGDGTHINISDLTLTSSLDWTCKVWSPGSALPNGVGHTVPLLELRSPEYEYIVDAKWAADHPAVFATATSAGQVDIWHLNRTLDEPVATVSADSFARQGTGEGAPVALSKLAWAPGSRKIAVGGLDGRVMLVQLDEELMYSNTDERRKLQQSLETRLDRLARLPDADQAVN